MLADDLELAWAAGFWDGEGCTYAGYVNGDRRTSRVNLSLSQCNKDHLDRFAAAVGYGHINGPYGGKRPNHRPWWQWRVSGKQALAVMGLLLPYLSDEKRRQFERIRDLEEATGQLRIFVV